MSDRSLAPLLGPTGTAFLVIYLASLLFRGPHKYTLAPGRPRESTLAAWHTQGLPEGANYERYLLETLGLDPAPQCPTPNLGLSFRMMPEFEEKVLEHSDGHYIVQDWRGAITAISDRYDITYLRRARDFVTRKWHKFPVENRADWENMAWRYDPIAPGRHPGDLEARCSALKEGRSILNIHFPGPFLQLRDWIGLENLCVMMMEDPDFVHEMVDFWAEFVSRTLTPALSKATPDQVGISEDIAYKAHSMISPAMVREFLVPAYDRWISEARAAGCELIFMDSDGHIEQLIPIWFDVGINCCGPAEVAAGNDIVAYRKQHGDRMSFIGGIDKRAMAAGGEALKREVMRVVPPLVEQGGILAGCDHGVPPDISWPNYVECTRLIARLTGWL